MDLNKKVNELRDVMVILISRLKNNSLTEDEANVMLSKLSKIFNNDIDNGEKK